MVLLYVGLLIVYSLRWSPVQFAGICNLKLEVKASLAAREHGRLANPQQSLYKTWSVKHVEFTRATCRLPTLFGELLLSI